MARRIAVSLGALTLCAAQNPHATLGLYTPVSNVIEHSQMVYDIGNITTAINQKDWATAKQIYTGGRSSCKSTLKARTLQGFVKASTVTDKLNGTAFYESFAGGVGDQIPGTGRLNMPSTFWDDMILGALDGNGTKIMQVPAAHRDDMRKMMVNKGILGVLTLYSGYELESAIKKARAGNFADDKGAPHAWDEGWAFYYGSDAGGKSSAWEFAKKRDLDFAYTSSNARVTKATEVKSIIADYFRKGQRASRNDTGSNDAVVQMIEARDDIYRLWALASIRAALKYAEKMQVPAYSAAYHMEAYAYFLAAAGWIEQAAPGAAAKVLNLLDYNITEANLVPNLYCEVKKALIPAYQPLGLDCDMVGTWKTHNTSLDQNCQLPACPPAAAAMRPGLTTYNAATNTTAGSNVDCVAVTTETTETDGATASCAAAVSTVLLMISLLRMP